ncbi:MAG: hypothetical protein R8M11_03095 [Gallionella sp.]
MCAIKEGTEMLLDWGTLISVLIGGSITLIATLFAHLLVRCKAKDDEKELIFGFLQGIHDELETLWDSYNDKVGAHLESLQQDQPFLFIWPVAQEYFTVYTANAYLIGRVDDHDLRKQIVTTYARAKGLIDSYKLNNELVHEYQQAGLIYAETQNPIHAEQVNALLQKLEMYASSLKLIHSEVKSDVTALLRTLRKKGVLAK